MEWELNTGDTAWMLASSALVLFMTVGLALFYGGLVRTKNVLSTFMHSIFAMGLISVVWFIAGYALGFGPSKGGFIGGGMFYFLDDVSPFTPGPSACCFAGGAADTAYDLSFGTPHMAYMVFQLMFAIITPALISGAFAERMKFRGMVVFYALWSLLVYSPVAHWVWGGGWLFDLGALDFAGGTVVHINAGVAALVLCIYLGKRRGWPRDVAPPHNVPMAVLGAGILWFGWFGFNGGSALGSGQLAVSAFTATHFGAAAAMIGWAVMEHFRHGKVTAVGAATGLVAGLVAITPASGFVRPWAAVVIGLTAGIICYFAINLKHRFGYDDSLDVVGVHMVGGIIGAVLTGVFATTGVNTAGLNGALYGNGGQIGKQLIGVGATLAYSGIVSLILVFIVDKVVGIRVKEEDEVTGLDLSQHGESAYSTADAGMAHVVGTSAGGPSA